MWKHQAGLVAIESNNAFIKFTEKEAHMVRAGLQYCVLKGYHVETKRVFQCTCN